MLTICNRYRLLDLVESAIRGDNSVTKSGWAKVVKCKIWDKANLMYKVSLPLYKSLSNIKSSVANIKSHAWWMFAFNNPQWSRKCRIVMKMLLGVHGLKSNTYKYTRSNDVMCELCTMYCPETINHVLFECNQNKGEQIILWQSVLNNCPPAMVADLSRMTNKDKTIYMLNALYCNFTPEWNDLYLSVCQFVSTLYTTRMSLK